MYYIYLPAKQAVQKQNKGGKLGQFTEHTKGWMTWNCFPKPKQRVHQALENCPGATKRLTLAT